MLERIYFGEELRLFLFFFIFLRENYKPYYGENTKIKEMDIMFNKIKESINNLKERRNVRKRLITDSEFLEKYVDLLSKKEKQMYAGLYKGSFN